MDDPTRPRCCRPRSGARIGWTPANTRCHGLARGVRQEHIMGNTTPRLPPQFSPAKRPRSLRGGVFVVALAFLAASQIAKAVDPLGATPHDDGTTTFRVWAPFV